jgi:hypothetical protein
LVTTLLDPHSDPAQDLIALYARRWSLELCFRDLKTTLGMKQLRCKFPEMVEKELLAFLVAHNLIRCVMAQAASVHQVPLERISFKGTLDSLRQYSNGIAQARNRKIRRQLWDDLLLNLARDQVPDRPGRHSGLEPFVFSAGIPARRRGLIRSAQQQRQEGGQCESFQVQTGVVFGLATETRRLANRQPAENLAREEGGMAFSFAGIGMNRQAWLLA